MKIFLTCGKLHGNVIQTTVQKRQSNYLNIFYNFTPVQIATSIEVNVTMATQQSWSWVFKRKEGWLKSDPDLTLFGCGEARYLRESRDLLQKIEVFGY